MVLLFCPFSLISFHIYSFTGIHIYNNYDNLTNRHANIENRFSRCEIISVAKLFISLNHFFIYPNYFIKNRISFNQTLIQIVYYWYTWSRLFWKEKKKHSSWWNWQSYCHYLHASGPASCRCKIGSEEETREKQSPIQFWFMNWIHFTVSLFPYSSTWHLRKIGETERSNQI